MIGPPKSPTAKLGLTDGSCPELTPPTERRPGSAPPPESADSRETNADVMQTTPMPGAAKCVFFVVRLI